MLYNTGMTFFLKEKGFSIIQGLMLAGLLSGTALVTSQLISNQKKVASSAESKDAVDELADLAYNFLQFQDNCFQTLTLNGLTGTPLTGKRIFNNIYTVNKNSAGVTVNSQAVFTTGRNYFANNVRISEMSIDYGAGNLSNLNPAVLEIRMRRNESTTERTKDGVGAKDLSKKISLVIQRDAVGTFRGCYAVKQAQANTNETGNHDLMRTYCTELGAMFLWDANTNTCNLRSNICPAGQFFVGISSTGIITDLLHIHMGFGGVTPVGWDFGPRTGISSVGLAHCRDPKRGIDIKTMINSSPTTCLNRNGVGFTKIGNQAAIRCL